MLLSLDWLREFTPYEGSAEELGSRLTMLGLELEGIVHPFSSISSIVVGHVLECKSHPDSDHLHCCKVDVGQEALLDIVCGAPNVKSGQKVAVALVGSSLPDGTVIKKAKLRGQPSFGMICSERELGLSEDHSGILVLEQVAQVGSRLVDVLPLDKEVLDISITPNRSDCLSILGLARETAIAFGLPFQIPEKIAGFLSGSIEGLLSDDADCNAPVAIEISDSSLCPIYSGRVISGINILPSPQKIRYRLLAAGIRPISNIVDVTNYILFECGQPLHSFDLSTLKDRKIQVKLAEDGFKFITLDGQERHLKSTDLCICDGLRPVALAGVMGGLETEITDKTKTVFLESAVFSPGTIRKTSRRLSLSSEASYRFERGIDQCRTVWSLDRAAAMMAQLGNGVISNTLSKAEPRQFMPAKIVFQPQKASELLGVEIDRKMAEDVLTGLGCQVNKMDTAWQVVQPSWRPDLTREADLIEEVGRFYGLDTIEPELPVITKKFDSVSVNDDKFSFWSMIKRWGAGIGLNEAINYSFVGHVDLDRLALQKDHRISILNPLSSEQDVLRTVIAPGLLNSLRNNLAHGASSVRLFELANTFVEDASAETGVFETGSLGLLLYGLRNEVVWPYREEYFNFSDLKGLIEHLFQTLHIGSMILEKMDHEFLSPCVSITIYKTQIGVMGQVKAEIADDFNARRPVLMAELNLDLLHDLFIKKTFLFSSLPVFPPVRRDITVIAKQGFMVGEVLNYLAASKYPLLEDAVLVDCFDSNETKERHLTYRLTFRSDKRTLQDGEVDKIREKIANSLVTTLGVRL